MQSYLLGIVLVIVILVVHSIWVMLNMTVDDKPGKHFILQILQHNISGLFKRLINKMNMDIYIYPVKNVYVFLDST